MIDASGVKSGQAMRGSRFELVLPVGRIVQVNTIPLSIGSGVLPTA